MTDAKNRAISIDENGVFRMPLRVTFDTNTFDKVVRPNVYANDPQHSKFVAIHHAVKRGEVIGFISETIIVLEGIGRDDRASVFGSIDVQSGTVQTSGDTFEITLAPQQHRKPLHPKQAERFNEAFKSGFRLLGAPRIGMPRVESDFYAAESDEALPQRLDRFVTLARAIEARGLGHPRVLAIARSWAARAPSEPWYQVLGKAKDIHETREVSRAVAEWSDADSVAAHYGYGNDLFCTLDVAAGEARRGDAAVLDADNRQWLSTGFGVKFVSLSDLTSLIAGR
jgi:hypothetical protein